MELAKAKPAPPPEELEVCLNLWWFLDADTKLVFRIAGRAYSLSGSDAQKLAILKNLATTDFHVAENFKLDEKFQLVSEFGTQKSVVAPADMTTHHEEIFRNVIDALENDLHKQLRTINSNYQPYRMNIPKEPLCVTTYVVEGQDGSLTPLIS